MNDLSGFGTAATALNNDFAELETLAGQLERLDIESDFGMERAPKLLAKFGECGQRIATGVQHLAKALEESRGRAEKAAEFVAARANLVHLRHQQGEEMKQRFQMLTDKIRNISSAIAEFKKAPGKDLKAVENELSALIDEAAQFKSDATTLKMSFLKKNADSMLQSLRDALRKIKLLEQASVISLDS